MTEDGNIFVPASKLEVSQMAIVEAIRTQTDRMGDWTKVIETQGGKLEGIKDKIAEMQTSIALMTKVTVQVDSIDTRLKVVETEMLLRKGERGLIATIFGSKGLAWLITAVVGTAAWFKGVFQ